MLRYGLVGVVLVGLVAAITLAAPAPGAAPGGRMGMGGMERPGMGERMPMMGGDVAAAGGNVYVISDGKLLKLDSDLKQVASVDLPRPEAMPGMPRGMMEGRGGRRGTMPGQPEAPAAPGMGGVGAAGGPTPEQMQAVMTGMQRASNIVGGIVASMARVDADANNVYVLMGGKITVYSTDLKEVKSADIVPRPE